MTSPQIIGIIADTEDMFNMISSRLFGTTNQMSQTNPTARIANTDVYRAGRIFRTGRIGNRTAILTYSGLGLVNTAITAQALLDNIGSSIITSGGNIGTIGNSWNGNILLMYCGVGFSLNPNYLLGEVVIPSRWISYDNVKTIKNIPPSLSNNTFSYYDDNVGIPNPPFTYSNGSRALSFKNVSQSNQIITSNQTNQAVPNNLNNQPVLNSALNQELSRLLSSNQSPQLANQMNQAFLDNSASETLIQTAGLTSQNNQINQNNQNNQNIQNSQNSQTNQSNQLLISTHVDIPLFTDNLIGGQVSDAFFFNTDGTSRSRLSNIFSSNNVVLPNKMCVSANSCYQPRVLTTDSGLSSSAFVVNDDLKAAFVSRFAQANVNVGVIDQGSVAVGQVASSNQVPYISIVGLTTLLGYGDQVATINMSGMVDTDTPVLYDEIAQQQVAYVVYLFITS